MINIATISGDGVGPEIIKSAKMVLNAVGQKFNLQFNFTEACMGGIAIDKFGMPMPDESVDICLKSDSVLLGAVGGFKWNNPSIRPESALLGIRKKMALYANYRSAMLFPELKQSSPLNIQLTEKGFDFVIVRELTGGIYFGESGYRYGKLGREAYDTEVYSEIEIERIARSAYELAETRSHRLCSIDKANVMESSRLWRKIIHDINEDYPTVAVTDMLVDNAAMQLVINPSQFDVIVTSNLFGDILSDLAGACVGSIGMLASASLGDTLRGLYEPIHGSAPDIAGMNKVNPIGAILSSAMLLRMSLNEIDAANCIETAIKRTLAQGYRTADILSAGTVLMSTTEMTAKIIENLL
ncbi:MAG: 3-isopropylmalate dehydrogenase [Clostridia bacterium]